MDGFLKVAAGVIITLVLCLTVEKQSKDFAILACIIACVMISVIAMDYFRPIISFFSQMQSLGKLDHECVLILLRCVGIGILSEIISLICVDAGRAALGKILQLTASIVILWVSLPLFTMFLELIEDILLFV